MKVFHLPDLGEGLQEAQIVEWKIKPGDEVLQDQVLVLVETAKATVDIPSPYAGCVKKLYGEVGESIEVGKPLIEFELSEVGAADHEPESSDSIVGKVETTGHLLHETHINPLKESSNHVRILPAARILAKKMHIDISQVKATGPNNTITLHDIQEYSTHHSKQVQNKKLSVVARSMARNVAKIHQTVMPVSIMDDADLHAWSSEGDLMLRVIRAILQAKDSEPSVNVHYDHETFSVDSYREVHLGIAVDSVHGLYVPVIKDVASLSQREIRECINGFKKKSQEQSFDSEDLAQPTIILSNYGSIMGRYATPLVVPPTVLMVGVGRVREEVCANDGEIEVHRVLPLSISFDHRALTGGEVARFLKALIGDLELEN